MLHLAGASENLKSRLPNTEARYGGGEGRWMIVCQCRTWTAHWSESSLDEDLLKEQQLNGAGSEAGKAVAFLYF